MLELGQLDFYRGKVRDVYTLPHDLLAVVASDRLSAFDVVLEQPIPYKGQVLNQMAAYFLDATADVVPNWRLATPHPRVTMGRKATPFKVEMVIRGYLSGHAWRTYAAGGRTLCGVALPEGLRESDPLPEPLITPTTKADLGTHDEDISREDILRRGIVSESDYLQLEAYTRALYARGQAMARERGLILVDTKYEFGSLADGTIVLIDEIHTPDSSRYFELDGYEERQATGTPQRQLSKEFVRQWLIEHGFQGQEGQAPPVLPDSFIAEITERYIALYERMTGTKFVPAALEGEEEQMVSAVRAFLLSFKN